MKLDVLNLVLTLALATCVQGQMYSQALAIQKDKLNSDVYSTELRPLRNQSNTMFVQIAFQIVSIAQVDDVSQSFTCNGFIYSSWVDQMVAWNPADYGGHVMIHPLPEDIWRPRVVLVNTLGERDLFDDDKAPMFVFYDGLTYWVPGGLFPASCALDMTNYPFDKQKCSLQLLVAMTLTIQEMLFVARDSKAMTTFYTANGEWELVDSSVSVFNLSTYENIALSAINIEFSIKRRPLFLIFNVVLPVVFLSFLNILVFVIPVESGEKIAYGITVLLALSVFMSIVSAMLPRSSTMPRVTVYLFILLTISVLTVVDSIFIVYIYHMEEKEENLQKAKEKFQKAFTKVQHFHSTVTPAETMATKTSQKKAPDTTTPESRNIESDTSNPPINRYKKIGKHIDLVSFIVFFFVWLGVTVVYMSLIATS
ncbi:neuronal acetylcholine receptor subunit alpha-6-like [Physella acuta]|uniref:neuronal acetylcholine receptor subunit alpha-6-like n=1 Tax=Physella acuta TaxID=109671 RepID=UPI0027DD4299|nr:neuronal acetylcholine receptor subunit alpha-6-like [Physella acuta]